MKKLIEWFKNLFVPTAEQEFEYGYKWATRHLKSGGSVSVLEDIMIGSSDPFDKGALKAVRVFKYAPPRHINCRCSVVSIDPDERGTHD